MTTQTWITGTSGDWSTAADWSSGVVPTSTVDAVINDLTGTNAISVTVQGTAVANSLTLDGETNVVYPSVIVSGSLTLNTSLTVDGAAQLVLNGGTLSVPSITSDNGTYGFLVGYGTVSSAVSGDVIISVFGGSTLKVQGSLAGDTGGFTIFSNNSTLELSTGTSGWVEFGGLSSTLKLDAPTAFTGSISNILVSETIDLVGITASSATYSGTTLTINETNGQHLTYNVSGSVAGDTVTVASDNNGGTLVYLSTPETSCIGAPERKYINDACKRAPELGAFSSGIRLGLDYPPAYLGWHGVIGACFD